MYFRLKMQPLRSLSSLSMFCQPQCWNHVPILWPDAQKWKQKQKPIKSKLLFPCAGSNCQRSSPTPVQALGCFAQFVFCHAEVLCIKYISPTFLRWKHDHGLGEVAFCAGDWALQQVPQLSKLLFFFSLWGDAKVIKLSCSVHGMDNVHQKMENSWSIRLHTIFLLWKCGELRQKVTKIRAK